MNAQSTNNTRASKKRANREDVGTEEAAVFDDFLDGFQQR
jgi:hypothetical protein